MLHLLAPQPLSQSSFPSLKPGSLLLKLQILIYKILPQGSLPQTIKVVSCSSYVLLVTPQFHLSIKTALNLEDFKVPMRAYLKNALNPLITLKRTTQRESGMSKQLSNLSSHHSHPSAAGNQAPYAKITALTLQESFTKKVVVHCFSNYLGNIFRFKLHEGIAFAISSLQLKKSTTKMRTIKF